MALDGKIRTPVDVAGDTKTYRFAAKLTVGGILG